MGWQVCASSEGTCWKGNAMRVLLPHLEKSQIHVLLLQHFAQGITLIPGKSGKGQAALLQRQSGMKIAICFPLHCAESKPRLLLGSSGLGAAQLGAALFGAAQGSQRLSGSRQGTRQGGSTILSLGSTPLMVMSSNETCNFRPWKKFLPNTQCSCQHSAPQQSAWEAVAGVK